MSTKKDLSFRLTMAFVSARRKLPKKTFVPPANGSDKGLAIRIIAGGTSPRGKRGRLLIPSLRPQAVCYSPLMNQLSIANLLYHTKPPTRNHLHRLCRMPQTFHSPRGFVLHMPIVSVLDGRPPGKLNTTCDSASSSPTYVGACTR